MSIRENQPVVIDIYRDGKRFGLRHWHHVPRVGDTIMLENGEGFVIVERVVWASAGNDSDIFDCWVQLLCKTDKTIEAKP